MRCYFCRYNLDINAPSRYRCSKCGAVHLRKETVKLIDADPFSEDQNKIISICLRNEYERRGRSFSRRALTLRDLSQVVTQYRPLEPIDKLDNALKNIERVSKYVGESIEVDISNEFPYYHCFYQEELYSLLVLLQQEGFISATEDSLNPHRGLRITIKGYERLRELRRFRKDSRKCFVAMWLHPDMDDVYKNAIKPAIEYIEEGEDQPRFEAVKIDNVEHANDINDEIIAAIRRSRFMVCDLTGYRGGVYFEAGFSYGLGMEVIYTCREDWVKSTTMELYDDGNKVEIAQEGIHFDLEHRNHIRWGQDNLSEFRDKLTKRIKAVIQ